MDNYIEANKTAWEEAFDNREHNWGENNYLKLKSEPFAFFDKDMPKKLKSMDFSDLLIKRNVLLLYPFIANNTISHGKAAELLGMRKIDLIEVYEKMGLGSVYK